MRVLQNPSAAFWKFSGGDSRNALYTEQLLKTTSGWKLQMANEVLKLVNGYIEIYPENGIILLLCERKWKL